MSTATTPAMLQSYLVEDIKKVFEKTEFLYVSGERKPLQVYSQDVPVPSGNDEEEDIDQTAFAPYCIVRILDGTFSEWNQEQQINLILVFCAFDNGSDHAGALDIMSMIQRVFQRFASNPYIEECRANLPIEWALQTEVDTFPYTFGALTIKFDVPGIKIEDQFS